VPSTSARENFSLRRTTVQFAGRHDVRPATAGAVLAGARSSYPDAGDAQLLATEATGTDVLHPDAMFELLSAVPVEQVETAARVAEIGVRTLGETGADGIASKYTFTDGAGTGNCIYDITTHPHHDHVHESSVVCSG
jgi:hypothetical protein